MAANWEGFNTGLGDIGKALADRVREQQAKDEAMQMMFQKALIENKIKNMYDPDAQLMDYILGGKSPQGGVIDTTATDMGTVMPGTERAMESVTPMGRIAIDRNQLLRGMLSKKFGVPYEQMMTPEEKSQGMQQKVQEAKAMELAKGIPTAETGKAALAKESLKNIEDIKNILFPKGTPESYRRDIATGSNIPLSGLPIIPSNLGFYNPQTVFRKVGAALSGRQLIQTGVAARPEETLKLIRQFAPSGLMSAKSAFDGLNELQNFYKDYLNILETKGIDEADTWAKRGTNKINQGQTSSGIKFTIGE